MALEQRVLQLEQGFRAMYQQIQTLSAEIATLKQCCCSNKLFFIRIENMYWFEDPSPERLNLGDRLPTEGVCNGAKAIAICEDATLYLIYIPEGDGWTVYSHTYGGFNICCGCGENG
jgi:hypothetical protein